MLFEKERMREIARGPQHIRRRNLATKTFAQRSDQKGKKKAGDSLKRNGKKKGLAAGEGKVRQQLPGVCFASAKARKGGSMSR